jgi:CHAD domain-containing protein
MFRPFNRTGEDFMLISGTSPGKVESVTQFAAKVFNELHQAIITQEQGAVKGDVDAIHDMRVAIRRLRVALSNFSVCFSREDLDRVRRNLEHLADALGGVRDFDVMIAAMELALTTQPPADHQAIKSFIRRLRSRRRRQLRRLVDYLRGEEYTGFKRQASIIEPKETVHNIHFSAQQDKHGQAA